MNKADRIAQVPGLIPSSPPAHASAVLKSWAADSTRTPCRPASARGKGECRLVARDKQERMAIAGEFFGKRPGRCLALRREGTQFSR